MREELIKMGYKKLSITDEPKAVERARKLACCLKDYKSLIEEAKKEQKILEKKESEYVETEAKMTEGEGTLGGNTNSWCDSHLAHNKGKIGLQSIVALPYEMDFKPPICNYLYIYIYIIHNS